MIWHEHLIRGIAGLLGEGYTLEEVKSTFIELLPQQPQQADDIDQTTIYDFIEEELHD